MTAIDREAIRELADWIRQGAPFDPEKWGQHQDQLDSAADTLLALVPEPAEDERAALIAERDLWKRRCAEETIAWADATQRADALEASRPSPVSVEAVARALMTTLGCVTRVERGECGTCESTIPNCSHPLYQVCDEHDWEDPVEPGQVCAYAKRLARDLVARFAALTPEAGQ